MKKVLFAVLLIFIMAVPAMAKTAIEFPATLTQDDFKAFSADLGMALSYHRWQRLRRSVASFPASMPASRRHTSSSTQAPNTSPR